MRSESIGKLAEALAKAQGMMGRAKKDSKNPFFKSNYANLESIVDAIQEPLSMNGIAFSHQQSEENDKHYVTTTLYHLSDEFISSKMRLILSKQDMQALGSAISYAKRYNLSSLVGLAETEKTDDDGEAAMGRGFQMGPVEIQKVEELAGMAKMSPQNLNAMVKVKWKIEGYKSLNEEQYQIIIKWLQEEAQKELNEEK